MVGRNGARCLSEHPEQLEWIPVYIDRLLGSQRWRLMTDFQRGWYWSLIIESVRSERPGYLRLNENLWRLAGARSKQFFERENAVVLACFEGREIEGEAWVCSGRLVRTLEEQAQKYRKKVDGFAPSIERFPKKALSASLGLGSQVLSREKPELREEPDKHCQKCGGTGVWIHGAHKREVTCHCRTMKVSVG